MLHADYDDDQGNGARRRFTCPVPADSENVAVFDFEQIGREEAARALRGEIYEDLSDTGAAAGPLLPCGRPGGPLAVQFAPDSGWTP